MDLPEITEVQRLELRPGDRLVVRLEHAPSSQQEVFEVVTQVRAVLGADVGVLVIGPGEDIKVIGSEADGT